MGLLDKVVGVIRLGKDSEVETVLFQEGSEGSGLGLNVLQDSA